MKLITEQNFSDIQYIKETKEEDGKKNYYIEGIFLQGDIKNRNGRRYPINVLENEVNRYSTKYIKEGRAYGELGHPNGPSINLDRVSHIITELKRDGSNFVGRAKLTETPMGNIARGLMESGGKLGVSSRGMGSLKDTNGIMEVQDDFHLATAADIVSDPSAPDAFVNGVMEGVEYLWGEDGTLKKYDAAMLAKKEIEEACSKTSNITEEKMNRFLAAFELYLKNI